VELTAAEIVHFSAVLAKRKASAFLFALDQKPPSAASFTATALVA
jgi:hypothetical protein